MTATNQTRVRSCRELLSDQDLLVGSIRRCAQGDPFFLRGDVLGEDAVDTLCALHRIRRMHSSTGLSVGVVQSAVNVPQGPLTSRHRRFPVHSACSLAFTWMLEVGVKQHRGAGQACSLRAAVSWGFLDHVAVAPQAAAGCEEEKPRSDFSVKARLGKLSDLATGPCDTAAVWGCCA